MINKYIQRLIKDNYLSIIIVSIIGFLNFLYVSTNFIYNNDTIGRIIKDVYPFEHGLQIGRWFYPLVYNTLIHIINVPVTTLVTTILFLLFSIILIWDIFNIKSKLYQIVIGGIIITSPLLIHYFFYEGDAVVYYFSIFLVTLSLWFYCNIENKFRILLPILLLALALGGYPALYGYITSIYFFYLINEFIKTKKLGKNYFINLLNVFFICIVSMALYYIITKFLLYILDVELISYRNAKEINIIQIILNLPKRLGLIYMLFYEKLFNSGLMYFIVGLINVIVLIYKLIYINRKDIIKLIGGIIILILLPIMTLSIYILITDNNPYAGFEFGFLIYYSLPIIFLKSISRNIVIAFSSLMIFLIYTQIQDTNKIALEHQLNVESSKLIFNNILHELYKYEGYHRNSKVVLKGNFGYNSNYQMVDIIPKSEMYNWANTPVGLAGNGLYLSSNMKNQIRMMGWNVEIVNSDLFNHDMSDIPEFPKAGSIQTINDTIVINIGNEKSYTLNNKRQVLNKIDALPSKNDSIESNFDAYEESTFNLKIVGWAALKGMPSDLAEVSLILYNEKNVYSLETSKYQREDVTAWIKDGKNYDSSGIIANLNKEELEEGKYRVGVSIRDNTKNRTYYKPLEYIIIID